MFAAVFLLRMLTAGAERGYSLTFESPKNEELSLFQHGERAHDHMLILPPKSKGTPRMCRRRELPQRRPWLTLRHRFRTLAQPEEYPRFRQQGGQHPPGPLWEIRNTKCHQLTTSGV